MKCKAILMERMQIALYVKCFRLRHLKNNVSNLQCGPLNLANLFPSVRLLWTHMIVRVSRHLFLLTIKLEHSICIWKTVNSRNLIIFFNRNALRWTWRRQALQFYKFISHTAQWSSFHLHIDSTFKWWLFNSAASLLIWLLQHFCDQPFNLED